MENRMSAREKRMRGRDCQACGDFAGFQAVAALFRSAGHGQWRKLTQRPALSGQDIEKYR
jgi:hypothetical protein